MEEIRYEESPELYNKLIINKEVPLPEIGINQDTDFFDDIAMSLRGLLEIENLTLVAEGREEIYKLIDTMSLDPTIAAALEIYAEDVTEPNDQGDIIWATSTDPEVQSYINYLLLQLDVDKHIYDWVYSLCKYGDCYIRLFKESEVSLENLNKKPLNESVRVHLLDRDSRFVNYVKREKNPANIFDLTKFGKTELYIKTPILESFTRDNALGYNAMNYLYRLNNKDVHTYAPEMYVHGYLDSVGSRYTEEILLSDVNEYLATESEINAVKYEVNVGLSVLYNTFKIWRQIQLLENSLLLNRLTKSSIIRLIGIEVGDMPRDKVKLKLLNIKQLFEQKSAINTGTSFSEYTNPGAMENNVYVATRNGKGAITTLQIGGDIDVKGLVDVDYFKNKLYSSLKIPKQFLGDTDDSTGFNGGTSLSILSSRYAKTVRRILTATILMIEDLINRFLIDRQQQRFIGRYTIHMQEPTTQEVMDRMNNMAQNVSYVLDIVNLLDVQDNEGVRLQIICELILKLVPGTNIVLLINEYMQSLEQSDENIEHEQGSASGGFAPIGGDNSFDSVDFGAEDNFESAEETNVNNEESLEDIILPSPAEANPEVDFSDNSEQ